jgi:hypothetical protein
MYSGLGAGTIGDPYQITTVSQFMEMGSVDYTGSYFLLMNDLDFSLETSKVLPNFYCHFDGDGHTLDSIELFTGGFITPKSTSEFKNITIIFNRFFSDNLSIFCGASALSTVIISEVNIICKNNNGFSVKLFDSTITFNADCVISNIQAEGNYSVLFPLLKCNTSALHVYNSGVSHAPLFKNTVSAITVDSCIYIKPYTYTTNTGNKGLFFDGTTGIITITNSTVVVSQFIDDLTSDLSISVGGFVGRGQMNITNSYVVGYFYSKSAKYIHALYGAYSSVTCTFQNCYFYGDIVAPKKADLYVVTGLTSTGCKYCKELLTNQSFTDLYATNLTVLQFQDSANFSGWDFSTIWTQGLIRPTLINASEDLSVFLPESVLDTGDITVGEVLKISGTQFQVEIITDNTKNFGFDIVEFGAILDYRINEKGNVVIDTTSDIEATIQSYHLIRTTKFYTDSVVYYHFYLDQIAVTDVIVEKYALLQQGFNVGAYIHGSILIGDYLYGTPRGAPSSTSHYHSIVKALSFDVSQFTLFPIDVTSGGLGTSGMDSVVNIGGYLYSVALNDTKLYMIVFDIINETYQSYWIGTGGSYGAPSCTDGEFIYIFLNGYLHKINPAVFNSESQFNTDVLWDIQSISLLVVNNIEDSGVPHTMTVDSDYLYVGIGTTINISLTDRELQKINKEDMTFIAYCAVPKMTDDMCQTATHLFLGIEHYNSVSVGYNIGCCAIRKSDLRVTKIRKLHDTDTVNVKSYAPLIFGNYLIDAKTNSHIYALDISDPDSWDNDNIGAHTIKAYRILQPGGSDITYPINEVCLPESGVFVGFAWNITSYVSQFVLPDLSYFSIPSVISDLTIIDNGSVTLFGYIQSTGGKTVTEVGFIIGSEVDLSDGITFPCASVETNFSLLVNSLSANTYFWKAYAINSEGIGYGEIGSFLVESTIKFYFGSQQINKIYIGSTEITKKIYGI